MRWGDVGSCRIRGVMVVGVGGERVVFHGSSICNDGVREKRWVEGEWFCCVQAIMRYPELIESVLFETKMHGFGRLEHLMVAIPRYVLMLQCVPRIVTSLGLTAYT